MPLRLTSPWCYPCLSPPNPGEEAVTFINLQRYPKFFDDMSRGFPRRMVLARGGGPESRSLPKLRVHDVGDFEASFVPRLEDFGQLDERFRIPADVWDRLPAYRDFGFAVFKLKASPSRRSEDVISLAPAVGNHGVCIRWLSHSPGETQSSCTSRLCISMIEKFTPTRGLTYALLSAGRRDRRRSSGLGGIPDAGIGIIDIARPRVLLTPASPAGVCSWKDGDRT